MRNGELLETQQREKTHCGRGGSLGSVSVGGSYLEHPEGVAGGAELTPRTFRFRRHVPGTVCRCHGYHEHVPSVANTMKTARQAAARHDRARLYVVADIGWQGTNPTCVGVIAGRVVRSLERWRESDLMRTARGCMRWLCASGAAAGT
jgi:hypothetical protein